MEQTVRAREFGNQFARVSGEFVVWWAVLTAAYNLNTFEWFTGGDLTGWIVLGGMTAFVPAVAAMSLSRTIRYYSGGEP